MSSSVEGGTSARIPSQANGYSRVKMHSALGDGLAAHAVEAVAAGDGVAAQLVVGAVVPEADAGRVGVDVVHADVVDLEQQLGARRQPRLDEVADHLLLAVDGDRGTAGQLRQRDPVPDAVEAQLEPLVHEPLAVQALAQPGGPQQVDGALLEHPGAHALLDVGAAARLEHDGLDPLRGEQVAE